jgi:hypothetical protein
MYEKELFKTSGLQKGREDVEPKEIEGGIVIESNSRASSYARCTILSILKSKHNCNKHGKRND